MTIQSAKDLSPFVNPHYKESVAVIRSPWSSGDWTYATNGIIAIRVPRLPDVPVVDTHITGRIEGYLAEPHGDWKPMPHFPETIICPICDGHLIHLCACCNEVHGCHHCKNGVTDDFGSLSVKWEGVLLSRLYLKKLQPFAPVILAVGADELYPAHFKFGNAVGSMMPRFKN